jgi:hypothetical protein
MSSGLPSPPPETNVVDQSPYFGNDGSDSIESTGHEKILYSEALNIITPPEESKMHHDLPSKIFYPNP